MSKLLVRTERAESPPRDNLLRTAPFSLRVADSGSRAEGDGLTLDGYAAVFNRETIIDSWEGRFREKLSPGSMKKSFRETKPKIQYDHGRHPLIGSIPIAHPVDGYPREESDPVLAPDGGAHIVARLADNWLVEPLRDAIAAGSVDGMSFRFAVMEEKWFDADGKPIRDEADLYDQLRRTWYEEVPDDELLLRDLRQVRVPELGPVAFPAYDDTSVGVRSKTVTIDLGRLDDPEQRKTLARAVLLADAAERMEEAADELPQATEGDEPPAGEHEESATDDEPQVTEDVESSADEHPSTTEETEPVDAQRSQSAERRLSSWERPGWYLG